MSLSDATISCTLEPSGEVRLSVRAPSLHGDTRRRRFAIAAKGAGCTALVYSPKVREKPLKRGGMGSLSRDTEFGRAAKRNIKNAVGCLKAIYGRQIVFATVTLPGSSPEARKALAEWSAKAIQLLTHWIRSKAPDSHYCYVWEHQKNGALHLHACIGSHDVLALRRLERGIKNYVHRMYLTLSRLSGIDMFARADGGSWRGLPEVLRVNCVPVRKCVKRYMSKYITKQAGAALGYSPSRWWGMSARLRAEIGAARRCIRQRSADWDLVDRSFETVRALISLQGYTTYGFSLPFSPLSRTLLIYPPEADAESAYRGIVRLLEDSYPILTMQRTVSPPLAGVSDFMRTLKGLEIGLN